jgi:hypothetical protein
LSPGDDHLLQEQLRPHRQSVFQCSLADASHRNSRW